MGPYIVKVRATMTKLVFLGTGGGRFSTIYQIRATGGLYLMDGVNMHIDPGPSAAHQMHRVKLDPAKTDAVLVSHCHPDHYTDAEVMIEGMSRGGLKKRGTLLASRSVLDGSQSWMGRSCTARPYPITTVHCWNASRWLRPAVAPRSTA